MVYRPIRYEQMMRAAEAYDVRARRMFNGMGVYTGEKMFAVWVGEDIGLKLGPEDLEEAMLLPGAEP
ncbi:MAG TPA: TfoX/Sxy family protein, partial [Fimbriimonadaceae bacterium]|nr:TfoX/Sxy family protein [Fimbriimonadaceae bacterium]